MDIISGILSEKDFENVDYDGLIDVFTHLKPLITASSANDISAYMNDPASSANIVKALKETVGSHVFMFKYAESLRYNKTNSAIADFNLFSALTEYSQENKVCGMRADEGLAVIKDVLDHRQNITARDNVATKEEYSAFMDSCKILGQACCNRIKMNKSRIYNPNSEGASTYLGVIVRKLEQLEMAYKGINYVRDVESRGVGIEGGSLY